MSTSRQVLYKYQYLHLKYKYEYKYFKTVLKYKYQVLYLWQSISLNSSYIIWELSKSKCFEMLSAYSVYFWFILLFMHVFTLFSFWTILLVSFVVLMLLVGFQERHLVYKNIFLWERGRGRETYEVMDLMWSNLQRYWLVKQGWKLQY